MEFIPFITSYNYIFLNVLNGNKIDFEVTITKAVYKFSVFNFLSQSWTMNKE